MKNIKFSLLIIVIFSISFSKINAQNKSNFSVQSKIGIAIFEKEKDQNPSDRISYSSDPGINLAGGIDYYQRIGNNFGASIGIFYEYVKFSRITKSDSPPYAEYSSIYQFKTQSIIAPFQIHYQVKKIRFSAGIAFTHHFTSQLSLNRKSIVNGEKSAKELFSRKDGETYSYTYYVGGSHWFNQRGGTAEVNLEKKWNQQIIIGCHYRLSSRLILDLEFRAYFKANYLLDIARTTTYYHPFSKTASVGLSWEIK